MRRRKNSPITSKPYPITWDVRPENRRGDGGFWDAKFSIPGEDKDEVAHVTMSLYRIPNEPDERAVEVAFDVGGEFYVTGKEGAGRASRIFATSIKAVEDFIERSEWGISTVFFTAKLSEPSRMKMYDTMSKILARKLAQGHGVPIYLGTQNEFSTRRYVISSRDPNTLAEDEFWVVSKIHPIAVHRWNPDDHELLSRVTYRYVDDPSWAAGRKKRYVQIDALLDGEVVGSANFVLGRSLLHARKDREGVWVDPKFRRKGLASALYDHAERHWGREVRHAGRSHQTPDGRGFARGRRR